MIFYPLDDDIGARWRKVPKSLNKWFALRDVGVCWTGEAFLTLTGHKMESLRDQMQEKYHINVLIDADALYYTLERIYQLERRLKKLETYKA